MEYEINIKNLCSELRRSNTEDFADKLCDTQGQRYLYGNVVQKFVNNVPVRLCDVDFDAFTEEDIVELIDNKLGQIEEHVRGSAVIVKSFQNTKALTAAKRKFF